MGKNKKGGKKHKRSKNQTFGKDLIFKEENQEYAKVLKLLGDSRVSLQCYDGIERLGIIRGNMKKRVWISSEDHVLIGLREFDDAKADIIHKYTPEEVRLLTSYGELTETTEIKEDVCAFEFDQI